MATESQDPGLLLCHHPEALNPSASDIYGVAFEGRGLYMYSHNWIPRGSGSGLALPDSRWLIQELSLSATVAATNKKNVKTIHPAGGEGKSLYELRSQQNNGMANE